MAGLKIKIRDLWGQILHLSLFLLILLPLAYLAIIYFTSGSVTLNKAKFVEESTKIFASFVLSIAAVGTSHISENIKFQRKASAMRLTAMQQLSHAKNNASAIMLIDLPPHSDNEWEERRQFREINRSLDTDLRELAGILSACNQKLLNAEPEVSQLLSKEIDCFTNILQNLNTYQATLAQTHFIAFRGALEKLLLQLSPERIENV
ncbi:MAG TPA: hypothetical protein VFC63_15750 [Blastocatellia bacterium]|nr:hypothetical protein [Blastocatellia bacterium]